MLLIKKLRAISINRTQEKLDIKSVLIFGFRSLREDKILLYAISHNITNNNIILMTTVTIITMIYFYDVSCQIVFGSVDYD